MAAAPSATFFHTSEWAQLWEKCYAFFKSFFLVDVAVDGSYRAGLPFTRARKGLDNYYSMPMGSYGGVVSTPSAEDGGLYAEWMKLAKRPRTERMMVFTERAEPALDKLGFTARKLSSHALGLSENFREAFSDSAKRNMEKARRAGFTLGRLEGEGGLKDFFSFKGRGRKKGLYTKSFYEKMIELLVPPGRAVWFCARRDGVLAAYQICFLFRNQIVFWDTNFALDFAKFNPGYFLKDAILRWAFENGFRTVNFGQTPGGAEGAVEFKRRMGTQVQPVFEYTYATPVKRKLRAALEAFRERG